MSTTARILIALLLSPALAAAQQPQATPFEVHEATVEELQAAWSSGRVTSEQLMDAYLARIAAYDRAGPMLNSVMRLNPGARADARRLDGERRAGTVRGPLHGVPILLKDNYDMVELPTTGS